MVSQGLVRLAEVELKQKRDIHIYRLHNRNYGWGSPIHNIRQAHVQPQIQNSWFFRPVASCSHPIISVARDLIAITIRSYPINY